MQGSRRITQKLKGIDESQTPEPGTAELIYNLTVDSHGVWTNRRDHGAWAGATATPPDKNVSCFWWQQRAGRQWILFEQTTEATNGCTLYYWTGNNGGGKVAIQSGRKNNRAPNAGTQYLPINDWLYLLNGYDKPVRWNGKDMADTGRVEQVGFPQLPPAPRVTMTTGKDVETNLSGTNRGLGPATGDFSYGWAITYMNRTACESPPSPISIVSGTNAAQRYYASIQIEDPPAHVCAIRVYRTVNLANVSATAGERYGLYFRTELAPMRQCITDGDGDLALGFELDTSALGVMPAGVKLQAHFGGHWWVTGSSAYPERIWYSAPSFVEQFPLGNTFDVGSPSGGGVTAMVAARGALIVFKRRGIYAVQRNQQGDFVMRTLTEDVGCTSPNAIVDVPGRGTLFLSERGPHLITGSFEDGSASVEYIGAQIEQTWKRRVNTANLVEAGAFLWEDEGEVLIGLPGAGGPQLHGVDLVYHYHFGWWSKRLTALSGITRGCAIRDHRGDYVACHGKSNVYHYLLRGGNRNTALDGSLVFEYRSNKLTSRLGRLSVVKIELHGMLSSVPTTEASWVNEDRYAVRWRVDDAPFYEAVSEGDPPVPEDIDAWKWWGADTATLNSGPDTERIIPTFYTSPFWYDGLQEPVIPDDLWLHDYTRIHPVAVDGDGSTFQWDICAFALGTGPARMSHVTYEMMGDGDIVFDPEPGSS